jgi:predicted membrane protein
MSKLSFLSKLGLFFLVLSAAIYSVHYLIFGDATFIFRYLIAQLGFLPLNVLLVTIVLNGLMSNRAKKERMQKLNMVIGAFFSDVGTDLLRAFARFDHTASSLGKQLILSDFWEEADFTRVKNNLKKEHFNIQAEKSELLKLNEYLGQKHDYLLRLFENPNLLEHESFSQLLWAIFHLNEELSLRGDLIIG